MKIDLREENSFIQRLTAIIETNLNKEHFGVNELAEKMDLSRTQIYRKLKKATDKSVSQFIREIRLKKAEQLLEEGNLTVSEIAYNIGFGSPSYFIKCFHDYFGYSPGEFTKHTGMDSTHEEDTANEYRKSNSKVQKLFLGKYYNTPQNLDNKLNDNF